MRVNKISLFVISLVIISSCKTKTKLSKEEETIVFESQKFKEPITIDLPFNSEQDNYLNIVANPTIVDNSFIPTVTFEVTTDKALKNQNQAHVNFLELRNMINVRRPQQTTVNRFGEKTIEYDFVFYTERISEFDSLLIKRNKSNYNCNLFKLGRRQLMSIETVKKVKDSQTPKKEIVFTYKIIPTYKYLTIPERAFKGVAIIAKQQNSQEYSLENISWGDNGVEYIISENNNIQNDETVDVNSLAQTILLSQKNSPTFFGITRGNTFSELKTSIPTLSEVKDHVSYFTLPKNLNSKYLNFTEARLVFDDASNIVGMAYSVSLSSEILFKKDEILNSIDVYMQATLNEKLTSETNYNYGLSQKFYGGTNHAFIIGHGIFYNSKHIITVDVYFQ